MTRDAVHKRSLCCHAVFVCPSVRLSVCLSVMFVDSVETNKHIFKCFHCRVATPFYIFHTKPHGNIPSGNPPPLTGASNAGGVCKNHNSRRISGYRSMTGEVRTTAATVDRAVYRTDRHASVNLVYTTTTSSPVVAERPRDAS